MNAAPDPTAAKDTARQAEISDRVAAISDQRAVIEQVKGVLAVVYGLDAEQAFQLLKWRSQVTNVKLRALAEQLFTEFCAARTGDGLPSLDALNHILVTAHQRIGGRPA